MVNDKEIKNEEEIREEEEKEEGEQEEKNYAFGKKFKYTLDSDEEDDEVDAEKYNVLKDEAIEGTEKTTIEFDGDIKITPFNMDEELETGHFDKEGTYIFKKEEEIHDNWLDNINWNAVHKENPKKSQEPESDEDEDDDQELSETRLKELYKNLIELLDPGENIRKAIQRYGKQCNNNKAANNRKGQKRKLNNQGTSSNNNNNIDKESSKEAKEKMMKLITIADGILQTGDMDIYEKTYEHFELYLRNGQKN